MKNEYSEVTPYIRDLAELSARNNGIVPEMYAQHKVNRGLRDINGNGVVTGLTEISHIKAKEKAADGSGAAFFPRHQRAGISTGLFKRLSAGF